MPQNISTSLAILFWCAAASLGIVLCAYRRAAKHHDAGRPYEPRGLGGMAVVPALILAPLTVALPFTVLHLNLIYPVQLLASPARMAVAAIAPAFVLTLASGLAQSLYRAAFDGYARWRARPFACAALAYGTPPRRALRRVVVLEALVTAWSGALPWIFSELIIVEAVFNAPGIGLAAWQAARGRDSLALAQALLLLIAGYGGLAVAAAHFNRRLGRRLESYA